MFALTFISHITHLMGFPGSSAIKTHLHAGVAGDPGLIPGSGRSPGGGNGNPLQHSCLENPMDRGAWRPAVHGVIKRRTQLKRVSVHACMSHLTECVMVS